ncbi:hypothetical protein BKA69DRAFT_647682 [Paraphysoderma sedebokerense]|nr:hypothetical protein BKA69DRAFT_647682 [Paraphysoderma sedebokerense]
MCDQGSGTIQSPKPVEIMEFTWQEKIFCPTELKKYSRLNKSPTPNERTYYEKITELLRKGDNYESRLLNKRSNVVERILFTGIDGDDIDEWNLTESDKESRCQRVNPKLDKCRQMVVMGQFPSASKESGKVVNIRLCQIRVYDGGSMVMMPGLSVQNTAYRFEISNNDIYEFSIENISGSFTEDEYEEERKIFSDIMKYNISLRKSAVENEFTEVPKLPYRIRVSVLGEIISAYDFSRSNL